MAFDYKDKISTNGLSVIAVLMINFAFANSMIGQNINLEIEAAINISTDGTDLADRGATRFIEGDFEVWNGEKWVSLTNGSAIEPLVNTFGGSFPASITDISIDPDDTLYVVGSFSDTMQMSGLQKISTGETDIFLSKYNPDGSLIWLKTYGGIDHDQIRSMVLDNNTNIVLTGYGEGNIAFSGQSIINGGSRDLIIIKLDRNGDVIWANGYGYDQNDLGAESVVDDQNNIYFIGEFTDSISFGITTLYANDSRDAVFGKLDPDGNPIWIKAIGGTLEDAGDAISVDNQNNLFIGGHFESDISFPGIQFSSLGDNDIFFARYDQSGNFQWAKQASSLGQDRVNLIKVNNSNEILLSVSVQGSVEINGQSYAGFGFFSVFVAKYTIQGHVEWVQTMGGQGSTFPVTTMNDLSLDQNGDFYCAGSFPGTGYFGDTIVYSQGLNGSNNIYLAKFNSNGALDWVLVEGSEGSAGISAMVLDQWRSVIVGGSHRDILNINDEILPDLWGSNLFITKYR